MGRVNKTKLPFEKAREARKEEPKYMTGKSFKVVQNPNDTVSLADARSISTIQR